MYLNKITNHKPDENRLKNDVLYHKFITLSNDNRHPADKIFLTVRRFPTRSLIKECMYYQVLLQFRKFVNCIKLIFKQS